MELAIFSKNAKTADGRNYMRYISHLTRKTTGEVIPVGVKFREECGAPKNCPVNIIVEKTDANLSQQKYTNKDGMESIGYTLWVSGWSESPNPYVDHSLDDFE